MVDCINLVGAFNQFGETHDKAKVSNVKSALYRYYGKGLEGKKTNQARLNEATIKRINTHLKKIVIDDSFQSEQFFKDLEKGLDLLGVKPKARKPIRSHFRVFTNFIEEVILKRNQSENNNESDQEIYRCRHLIDYALPLSLTNLTRR